MRTAAALALLLAVPNPHYFRDSRSIQVPAGAAPQVCAVLDADVFAHTAPTLADLRLYTGAEKPLPYAITISESTLLPPDPARILNLVATGAHLAFDVEMPTRSYTQLNLTLRGANFLATARITGLRSAADPHPFQLGSYAVYDLSAQRLGRLTSIPLPESTFPLLHVELTGSSVTPTMIQAAEVPPARDAQGLYTSVAQTAALSQRGQETVAQLDLPAHVPVERIRFTLPPGSRVNFSRTVKITAVPLNHPEAQPEFLAGEITHVHLPAEPGAPAIDQTRLTIPATLGANLESAARVELAVQNGDDPPVSLASAALEMRERKLCFLATPAATSVTLDYGDPALDPAVYELARLFNPAAPTRLATLGPEQINPAYTPRRTPHRSFVETHPELPWIALLGFVGVVAVLGFRARSSR